MKYFALVWSSLKRKKTRTILTLLSIFVAFLLYGLLCAVKEAFTAGVKERCEVPPVTTTLREVGSYSAEDAWSR